MLSPRRTASLLFGLSLFSSASSLSFQRIQTASRRSNPFDLVALVGQALGTSGNGTQNTIDDHRDIRYSTNITLGGQAYVVALDTGSTDLWVIPPNGVSGDYNDTKIPLSLLYGDGTYGVNGTIALAKFQMGSYSISQQAFLHVDFGTIQGFAELGIDGLLGFGFNFANASPINQAVQARYGPNTTWGNSVLSNIFSTNPDVPNFIALDLSRTDDLEETDGGFFSIGEYVDEWKAVADAPKLPQYPVGGNRWTALLEGITVGNTSLNLTSQIRGVPNGQLLALLDTGDPTAVVPTKVQNGIYSRIPGAVMFTQGGNVIWILPCNTTTIVEFTFGGQNFPIHPLDLSVISGPITVSDQQYTACIASMDATDQLAGNGFEVSLGDVFLRNVYSVFDFGDAQTNGSTSQPYIQLLTEIDIANATAEVAIIRNRTMATLPPEIPPAELLGLLMGENPTIQSPDTSPASRDCPLNPRSLDMQEETRRQTSSDQPLPLVSQNYSLAIVGLLAGNMAVGLILLVLGVLNYTRQSKLSRRPTRTGLRYVPVKSSGPGQEEAGR